MSMFRRDNSTRALNIVTRSYKYRIYPDSIARTRIDTTIETCRRLYNRFLWNNPLVDRNGA